MSTHGPWDNSDESSSVDDTTSSDQELTKKKRGKVPYNVVELIDSDRDYLNRLVRKNQATEFITSVEEYIAEKGKIPFDSSGKVCTGDQSDEDKAKKASLFETAINTKVMGMITLIIQNYLVTNPLSPGFFKTILKSQPLLSIITTTFPHWLQDVIITTPYTSTIQPLIGSTLSLCSCDGTSTSSGSKNTIRTLRKDTNNNIPTPKCLCHAQRIAIDFVHTIQPDQLVKLFKYTYKHFGCYPCNIDGFFPMAVEISDQNSKLKVNVQYSSPLLPYQQFLIRNNRIDLVQPFLSTITSPLVSNISNNDDDDDSNNDNAEWNSDEQYSTFTHYFDERMRSSFKSFSNHNSNIARKSVETSTLLLRLAQVLFEACLVVDNWQDITTYYLKQLSSPVISFGLNTLPTSENIVTDSEPQIMPPNNKSQKKENNKEVQKGTKIESNEPGQSHIASSYIETLNGLSQAQHDALASFEQLLSAIIQIVQKLSRPIPLLSLDPDTPIQNNSTNNNKDNNDNSNAKILETVKTISLNVYTVLYQLLTLVRNESTISKQNPLLQHIFIHFMPYLCPFHFPIILSVIPLSLLQSLHPALFCHFTTNYDIYVHNPVMTTEYHDIIYWHQERHDDLLNVKNLDLLPQFLLPLHPLVIFASLVSTNRLTNISIQSTPTTVPTNNTTTGSTSTIPTEFKFSNQIDLKLHFPSLERQLLTITSTPRCIKPFIDPYMISAPITNPNTDFHPSCLRYAIYFPRYIEHFVGGNWTSASATNQTILNSIIAYLYHSDVPKLTGAFQPNTLDFKLFQITSKNDFLYDLYQDQLKRLISSPFSLDVFNGFIELQICGEFLFTHPDFTMTELWQQRGHFQSHWTHIDSVFQQFDDSDKTKTLNVSSIQRYLGNSQFAQRVWDNAIEYAGHL